MFNRGGSTVADVETDTESSEEEPNSLGSRRPDIGRYLPHRAARSRLGCILEQTASSDVAGSGKASEDEGGVQRADPADFADDEDETRWLDSTQCRLGLRKQSAGKDDAASHAARMAPYPPKGAPGGGFQKMLRVEIRNLPSRKQPHFFHYRFSSINALNQGKLASLPTPVSVHSSRLCDAEILRVEAPPLTMAGRGSKRKASMPDISEQSISKKVVQTPLPSRPAIASYGGSVNEPVNEQQPAKMTKLDRRAAGFTSGEATPSINSNSGFKGSSSRTTPSTQDQEAMDTDSSDGSEDVGLGKNSDGKEPSFLAGLHEEPDDGSADDFHDDTIFDSQSEDVDETQLAAGPAKRPKPKRVTKTRGKMQTTSSSDEDMTLTFKTIREDLPPMSDLSEIFNHLTLEAYGHGLKEVLETLSRRSPIRVATMCSGTESPLLAINMIRDALARNSHTQLQYNHLFSGEIVPFKQAFIQRNFSPAVIFRDIRELCKSSGKASTAYGSPSEIPNNVELLIAGFSCVDFSRLSNKNKTIHDVGESGDTFRSILVYAKTHNPSIILLENINTAPWDDILAIWRNDRPHIEERCEGHSEFWGKHGAYAAAYVKLDTKDYYLPHTRQRGYMICVNRDKFPSADEIVERWKEQVELLQRPASSSVEAFLLKDDDPRVCRAKDEIARIAQRDVRARKDVLWIKSQGRHQDYRAAMKLGTRRPVTHWINDSTCLAPDYWWQKWVSIQVERLWDTFEVSFLRNAIPSISRPGHGKPTAVVQGFDSMFKTRIWELSQNIDRFTDKTPMGITGCITPSGQPFITTRGAPITGLEALALQGLPIDKIVLMRESQKELQDLAGNAMTSTVVGAAILAALIVGVEALEVDDNAATYKACETVESVLPMNVAWLESPRILELAGDHKIFAAKLCEMAQASIRLCYCEGQTSIASAPIVICKDCGHTACEKCGKLPRHSYIRLEKTRADPKKLHEIIKRALPMRLQLVVPTYQDILNVRDIFAGLPHSDDLAKYKNAFESALGDEMRFKTTQRSGSWTVVYEGTSSRLELVLGGLKAHWLLFAKSDPQEPGNSRIRKLLQNPIARMIVQGSNVLQGSWEICLPITRHLPITVTGQGKLTESWEARLGLQDPAVADKKVWTLLDIKSTTTSHVQLDHNIDGTYALLQNCGTAMGSLHKKVSPLKGGETPLFLFLDPDRIGNPNDDQFVFSTDKRRLLYEETRYTVARMKSSFRPSEQEVSDTSCSVFGQWRSCNASLQTFNGPAPPEYAVASTDLPSTISNGVQSDSKSQHCADQTIALLSCNVPLRAAKDPAWRKSDLTTVDILSERQVFSDFSWLAGRASELGKIPNKWRELILPSQFMRCMICAPLKPVIKWRARKNKSIVNIAPYEDFQQAGDYERAIKARPASFVVQTQVTDNRGYLTVGLNISAMAHRLLTRAQNVATYKGFEVAWRLDTHYDSSSGYSLPKFSLKSNKDGIEAHHRFPYGELRKEQKRSLHWMINQEAQNAKPFMNEDVEEATLQQLGWRAEVRVRTPQKAFGGVLADEVGYGKTATTLALIDAQMPTAIKCAKEPSVGSIALKATLIIVSDVLVAQWAREAQKFFRGKYQVLKIIDPTALAKITVAEFQEADIIVASSITFTRDAYWNKVAALAAMPQCPNNGGRAFYAWLERANSRIAKHTEELKYTSPKKFHDTLYSRLDAAENDEELHNDVPTRRLRGAEYAAHAKAQQSLDQSMVNIESLTKSSSSVLNPFKNAGTLGKLKGPSFLMFLFHRLVVDEYTYVNEKIYACITSLKAKNRWVLSGTPPLDDFADIHTIASFLNVRLGIEDDAAGVLKSKNMRCIRRERTAAEKFRAFGHSHTTAWHGGRDSHAQKFLDQFVRQNTAETDEIPSDEKILTVKLHAAESAVYMELQQQLASQDMKIVRGGSARNDGDRVNRMKALLRDSRTPEETLIKCVSQSNKDGPSNNDTQNLATSACKGIIETRKKEKNELVEELREHLKHAVWLERRCNKFADGKKDTHYQNWKSNVESGVFGDQESTSEIIGLIKSAGLNYKDSDEECFYYDPRTKNQATGSKKITLAPSKAKTTTKASKNPVLNSRHEFSDGSDNEDSANTVNEPESNHLNAKASKNASSAPTDTRAKKISPGDQAGFVFGLRILSGHLRALSTELVARTRALRFLLEICNIHLWHSDPSRPPSCMKCGNTVDQPSKFLVLGSCGHTLCHDCLLVAVSDESQCTVQGCAASAAPHQIISATELAIDYNNGVCVHGSKLDAVIKLIRSIPDDEQVLMFVQFDQLIEDYASVFNKEGISNHFLVIGRDTNAAAMKDFQENETKSKKKVLMLNAANETCAGANLTNANHVIFVSPLVTSTPHQFAASYKQCIGRSKRYGQLKTVHVYKFLALKTIDVDIQQQRDGKKLIFKNTSSGDPKKGKGKEGDGVWTMLPESKLKQEQRETDWGSGFAGNTYLDDEE